MRTLCLCCTLLSLLPSCTRPSSPEDETRSENAPAVDRAALEAQIEQALELRAVRKQLEGIALLEKTRVEALEAHQPELATLALNRRGDLASDLGRSNEANRDYEAAYAEASARNDYAAMGRAAHDRAYMNPSQCDGDDADAYVWYPRAIEARRKAGDLAGVRRSANNLAIQYFYAQKKDEAVRWYTEAAEAGEAAQDWNGTYKVLANLSLLYAVDAEGAFVPGAPLRAWVPPAKLDAEAEAKARHYYQRSLAVAQKAGLGEDEVCGVFGNYGARCKRLTPNLPAAEGRVACFAELALEAETDRWDDGELQAGLLSLRAADAAREAGPGFKTQVRQFEGNALRQFNAAADRAGGVGKLCDGAPEHAVELCARLYNEARKTAARR